MPRPPVVFCARQTVGVAWRQALYTPPLTVGRRNCTAFVLERLESAGRIGRCATCDWLALLSTTLLALTSTVSPGLLADSLFVGDSRRSRSRFARSLGGGIASRGQELR